LTGGVSKTEGIDAFVLDVMDLPSRVSSPLDANRMPPGRNSQEYSAAAGIIRYISERERDPFRYLDNPLIRGVSGEDAGRPSIVPETRVRIKLDENNKASGSGFNPLEGLKNAFKDLF
jgi:cell division protein FtsA